MRETTNPSIRVKYRGDAEVVPLRQWPTLTQWGIVFGILATLGTWSVTFFQAAKWVGVIEQKIDGLDKRANALDKKLDDREARDEQLFNWTKDVWDSIPKRRR